MITKLLRRVSVTAWLATLSLQLAVGLAQDVATITDLTDAEYAALARISENSVKGTISFLACDELGGRGTPSKELNIAAAYVASRLRAAGAQGLGPDGSFYLESTIDTIQTPRIGCKLASEIHELRASLIEGAADAFRYQGRIAKQLSGERLRDQLMGPVLVQLGDSEGDGPPAAFQLRREALRLAARGATAMLVEASPDSELWEIAEQAQQTPRIASARTRFALPIIVVEQNEIAADSEIRLNVPANLTAATVVRNVTGVIRGSDPALRSEALLFSAHLDHLGTGTPSSVRVTNGADDTDRIYNGADDDASGVTAVLTLADAFGALETAPKRSLIFVAFWGEERGLLGSKKFVQASPWPLKDIVANINIEMIGRPEDGATNKCWMTGWQASNLGSLVVQGSRRLGVETFEHPSYSARLYRASDNYSFVQQGVIAHSFSAGSLHADYHQPSDEWQKLELPHMTQVIRGLYAGTLPIAQGQLTPTKL